jgi:hypothetical protein
VAGILYFWLLTYFARLAQKRFLKLASDLPFAMIVKTERNRTPIL